MTQEKNKYVYRDSFLHVNLAVIFIGLLIVLFSGLFFIYPLFSDRLGNSSNESDEIDIDVPISDAIFLSIDDIFAFITINLFTSFPLIGAGIVSAMGETQLIEVGFNRDSDKFYHTTCKNLIVWEKTEYTTSEIKDIELIQTGVREYDDGNAPLFKPMISLSTGKFLELSLSSHCYGEGGRRLEAQEQVVKYLHGFLNLHSD